MKKIIPIALISIFAMTIFAACSRGGSKNYTCYCSFTIPGTTRDSTQNIIFPANTDRTQAEAQCDTQQASLQLHESADAMCHI